MDILLKDKIKYYPGAIDLKEANQFYDSLSLENWKRENIRIYGRICQQARDTCSFSKDGKSYTYSGLTINPELYNSIINKIHQKVLEVTNQNCDYFLCNRYGDNDSIGLHSDDVRSLDEKASIISVSFGQTRKFIIRDKISRSRVLEIDLKHGDILEMLPGVQSKYSHEIPKLLKREQVNRIDEFISRKRVFNYRISLTGRVLKK